MKEIDKKSVYLEEVGVLNRKMNGTIQNVIDLYVILNITCKFDCLKLKVSKKI